MSESPSESSAWKAFHEQTDSLFEDLIRSSKESLHHNDRFAWLLQQYGFFNRNQIDQIDRTNLANDLYERACEHLNDLRSHIRELMKTLLLICHSPAADKTTLVAWRHQISDHRDAIAVLLTNNPSLTIFPARRHPHCMDHRPGLDRAHSRQRQVLAPRNPRPRSAQAKLALEMETAAARRLSLDTDRNPRLRSQRPQRLPSRFLLPSLCPSGHFGQRWTLTELHLHEQTRKDHPGRQRELADRHRRSDQ